MYKAGEQATCLGSTSGNCSRMLLRSSARKRRKAVMGFLGLLGSFFCFFLGGGAVLVFLLLGAWARLSLSGAVSLRGVPCDTPCSASAKLVLRAMVALTGCVAAFLANGLAAGVDDLRGVILAATGVAGGSSPSSSLSMASSARAAERGAVRATGATSSSLSSSSSSSSSSSCGRGRLRGGARCGVMAG